MENLLNRKSFRIKDDGLYPPRAFRGGDVYILDDVDPNAEQEEILGMPVVDVHTSKCGYVRRLFERHSEYRVHSVRFPEGTLMPEFWAYWRHQLQSKQVEDLVIIYFHGTAGNEEKNYTWSLSQPPNRKLNAWKFINMVNESKAHSLFLLDCYIHTRITAKWKLKRGNTEIISRQATMQSADGRSKKHAKDFTEAMVLNMLEFLKGRRGRFNNRNAMITIPNIMAGDKQMYSNVQRIWLDRSRAGMKKVVQRFKLDPGQVRVTGRLEFFSVQLRGAPVKAHEDVLDAEDGLDADDDEGFVDDDGVGGHDLRDIDEDDEDEDGGREGDGIQNRNAAAVADVDAAGDVRDLGDGDDDDGIFLPA